MTANQAPRKAPERVIDLEAARQRHTSQTEHLVVLLTAGDPLADAAVAELDLHGTPARQALDMGLKEGLASLGEHSPTAITALLKDLEATPSWVAPLTLHRGDVVSQSVPPIWSGLCSITSALAHTYASPTVARLLAGSGTPTDTASRSLVESAVWARQVVRPGGLLRGGQGYVATAELRLRHARMRARSLADWDTGAPGLPIGHDMVRTWLGFTLIAYRALTAVGIEISPDEERHLYRYWSYVAHLLGLDERLHQNVADHTGARRLQDLLDSVTPSPDENSRTLTTAMVEGQAHAMAGAPGMALSEEQLSALMHTVLRQTFGEPASDRMGLPAPATPDLMPLIGTLNRQARHWQTFSPASAREAHRRALGEPGPDVVPRVPRRGTRRRRSSGAGLSNFPAA
ncbi:oxygenase MpaB family protein [Streptomyces sp. NPDC048420]|uniref:oxygenase MpaB family protein n=1 Tax=Streptomyces sp. NPDC048420 TaxID=3155755 RepID=UPI0034399999